MTHRGTTNRNERGSAAKRRELKTWMLAEFGDGISAPCSFCARALFYSQITKDRFPTPGRRGGRYVKGNVRPACLSCNARLRPIEKARIAALLPPMVRERYQRFSVCDGCARIFWEGTHWRRMRELVDSLLATTT